MRASKGYVFRVWCSRAEVQRQAESWGSFVVGKRDSFSFVLFGGCWLGEAGGGQLEVEHLM